MPTSRIIGIVLLVVGCILLALAYSGSQSIGDQTRQTFTGQYSDRTTLLLLGGAASAVAGVVALLVPWGQGRSPGYST
jgi:hypothetical protein